MYRYLRKKVTRWFRRGGYKKRYAGYILLVPDLLHLLIQLIGDSRISARSRSLLIITTVYFISPLDLFPELLAGPAGYLEDVAFAMYALNSILNRENSDVVREHWQGEEDLLRKVQSFLSSTNRMIGGGLWKTLKQMFYRGK